MLDSVIEYFGYDPLKLLYLFGGAGGVWFWIDKWKGRVRLDFELGQVHYNPQNQRSEIELNFKCRNIGNSTTSLIRQIPVSAYIGMTEKRFERGMFIVEGDDLILPPHSLKKFKAKAVLPAGFFFSHLLRMHIKVTRGRGRWFFSQVRLEKPVSVLRYCADWIKFKKNVKKYVLST